MQNDRRPVGSLPHRHQHDLDDEVTILARTPRPADHEPGIQIQRHTQIQPVLGGATVGDVRHPFGVGAVAVKSRSKWFCVPAGGTPEAFRRQRRRCGTPCKPAWRIKRATRCRPHRVPAYRSSSHIRGLPITPSCWVCRGRMRAKSRAFFVVRALGGRVAQS